MGNININYTNGSLGGVVPSTDFITGFIFDSTVLPAGMTSTDRIKVIYSIKDAEDIGIVNTSIDETKATGATVTVSAIGAVGDYITVTATPKNNESVILGTYTVKNGDTAATVTSGIVTAINLKTPSTGWASTGSTNSFGLTPPSGLGESINGSDIITTSHKSTTTFSTSINDFSDGVGSQIDIMHYTLDRYFKANSNSKVYVGVYDFTSAFDATKIATIQTYAQGEIRQLGIFSKDGLQDVVAMTAAMELAAVDQSGKHKPLSVVMGCQPGTITSANDLISLRTLTSPHVSFTIGNEYGTTTLGYQLKGTTGIYPTDLGEVLGHVSRSKVSDSIAWVQNNLTQNADVMLITGESWIDIEDTVVPTQIANKGYIFERKYVGYAGSYFDNDAVADAFTSDYDSIKRQRTMDKVARIAYNTLVPYLSSPLILNATSGAMSEGTISKFTGVLDQAISVMFNATEISGFSVYINPAQNVLSTKTLEVVVKIVPVGSADTITVNIGYALSVQ